MISSPAKFGAPHEPDELRECLVYVGQLLLPMPPCFGAVAPLQIPFFLRTVQEDRGSNEPRNRRRNERSTTGHYRFLSLGTLPVQIDGPRTHNPDTSEDPKR